MKPIVQHAITFPPFPKPTGVEITPFSQFTECGIEIELFGDGGTEVDGRRIPTIELRKKHDTDVVKSNPRKRKIEEASQAMRQEQVAAAKAGDVAARKKLTQRKPQPEWWQDWQAGDDLRFISSSFTEGMSAQDRLLQAASEFLDNRPALPPPVRELWDQFQVFLGVLSHQQTSKKNDDESLSKGKGKATVDGSVLVDGFEEDASFPKASALTMKYDENDDDDDDDDFEDDTMQVDGNNPSANDGSLWPSFLPRHDLADHISDTTSALPASDVAETTTQEMEVEESLRPENTTNHPPPKPKVFWTPEMRMQSFIDDPANSIRVFLSSYMRVKGLIWYDRNLTIAPRAVRFWLEFVKRNGVLTTSTDPSAAAAVDASVEEAIAVASLALKELPLTSKFGKTIPDDFALAAKDCWGPKTKGEEDVRHLHPRFNKGIAIKDESKNTDTTDEEDRSSKRAKLGPDSLRSTVAESEAAMQVDQDVNAGATTGWGAAADAASTASGWGTDTGGSSGWGNGEGLSLDPSIDISTWSTLRSLMPILGPHALPITHSSGVVEASMRRIARVIRAASDEALKALDALPHASSPSAAAVEADLAVKFARVELTPWRGWDGDRSRTWPYIPPSSRGRVVRHEGPADQLTEEAMAAAVAAAGPGAHDPAKDPITLLVAPGLAEYFEQGTGMGLEGTFVQLVRASSFDEDDSDLDWDQRQHEDEGDLADEGTRFWYMDSMTKVFPSFYTRHPLVE